MQLQWRMGMAGPVGLDIPAAAEVLAAHGVPRHLSMILLPYVERGWATARAGAAAED